MLVSSNEKLSFSKNEKRLFFGLRPAPIVKDTTLLDEETVNVEVWTYNEPRLYTVQKMQVQNDQKKAFRSLYDFSRNKMIQIADPEFDLVRYGDEGDSEYFCWKYYTLYAGKSVALNDLWIFNVLIYQQAKNLSWT